MSRPEKPIDWRLVDHYLEAGCTGVEIAAHFDMHPNTFYDRVAAQYNVSFTEYSTEKNKKGESNLRAVQYARALGLTKKGDNRMLEYLGKVRLKQREEPDEIGFDAKTLQSFNDIMAQLASFQDRKIADKSMSTEANSH